MSRIVASGIGVALFATLMLAAATSASAAGDARVQQSDGTVNVYSGVMIKAVHGTVRVTSADERDTLIFYHAACSFEGAIRRCLPYKIRLDRRGVSHAIGFEHGTVYMNLTSATQQLPFSSKQLPPNGVMLFVRTIRGTLISVHGTLDEVKP